jgi:hypothetical protein
MMNYCNIVEGITDLQARGFSLDFSLIGNKLLCAQEQCYLGAGEFDVLENHRFDADGRARDEIIVYAIESLSRSLKGILLSSGNQALTLATPVLIRKIRKFWM